MGSYNHSLLQARLAIKLGILSQYEVFIELSIEINGNEYKPDVCLYPKVKSIIWEDIIRMTELPVLAIEILSPSQYIQDLIKKIKAYFSAGIKSTWLVIPIPKSITVFSSLEDFETFSKGNVIDNVIGVELAINELFN